jgi:hypothetical protein
MLSDILKYSRSLGWAFILAMAQPGILAAEKVLVEAGKFTEVFDPKAGETEPWCINDHTIIRGPDGLWHVFGITHILPVNFARDPGKNLLHATAKTLTQNPWHKERFAVTADWDKYGEWLFWAPHVIKYNGLFYMFVCAGNNSGHQYKIDLLTSKDLWNWERSPANPLLIDGFDGRDPNVLRDGDGWILYYTATSTPEGGNHLVAAVTSKDLTHWIGKKVVFTHPEKGTFGGPTESPFVVRRGKSYYLFACDGGTINVYLSQDPLHWEFTNHVGAIYAHASEVVRDLDGKWYISHAGWEQGGLSIAPLIWKDGLDKETTSLQPGG